MATDSGEPPGPSGWPLLGNTVQFARAPFRFYDRCREFGDVVPYTVGGQRFYMVLHPDDIERVLSTEHARFGKGAFQREQLGWLLGEGLLTSEGEQWREQRRRIQPSFSPEKIDAYVETMTDCAERACERWTADEPLAVDAAMRRVTVRILARSLFGTDIERHVETIATAMNDIGARAEAGLLAALVPPWVPTPQNRRAKRGQAAIDDVIADLIERRQGDTADRDDLLSTLIAAYEADEIERAELRDQLVTFLLAGHETTSLALTYTWYLLARHGSVREKLHAELDETLGGATPTLTDLADLPYTDRVVTESMRLYPPVYRVLRETTEPVEIGGYELDAGTNLTLPQWLVHRDPRFYDDPRTFRPERWTDEFEAALPAYAYFPFGGGPRRCIGMRFAKLEAKLVLATVAQRYRLDLVDGRGGLDLQPGATVAPAEPVEMRPSLR